MAVGNETTRFWISRERPKNSSSEFASMRPAVPGRAIIFFSKALYSATQISAQKAATTNADIRGDKSLRACSTVFTVSTAPAITVVARATAWGWPSSRRLPRCMAAKYLRTARMA